MKKTIFMMMLAAVLPSCNTKEGKSDTSADIIIGKNPVEVKNKRLSAEILHTLGQVSSPSVSPDGKTVVYAVAYTDIALNRRNRELFTVGIDGSEKKQITASPKSESDPQWIKNGQKIAFLYDSQIWEMNPDGSERVQISHHGKGIDGFKYSPDGKKILFISPIKVLQKSADKYPDLDKASGRIIDNLMYKHWDEWVETVPHPYVAQYDGEKITHMIDIMACQPFESPMKPFGGIEQLDWSPDSRIVAYTSRKKTGKEYAVSTNSDIYFYHTETRKTTNMTEGMAGYDVNPKFSPDGKYLAWQSMERDGYEADKNRLFVMNLATGEKYYLTENFDYNADDFCWGGTSSRIYMLSNVQGTSRFFSIDFPNGDKTVKQITQGQYDYVSIAYANGYLVGLRQSMSAPSEVYAVPLSDIDNHAATKPSLGELGGVNISQENTDILSQITMGKVEPRRIKTTDNKEMLTWVIYPPDFDPDKKYPALLFCEGGPQNTVSQFWSLRWNFQIMAAHGYIVVAPNRRGVPGFGQAWCEQISGDYGGQNMKDYLSAIDALAKEPYVDAERLGCTGASYGGFSVYWLAGHHNKRFKAFWAHAGIFNLEAKYLETDELWFPNWDLGGAFWDKSDKTVQNSYAASPHRFVDKWDTPIAVSHGELDYRILASQGMMAFNAAQLRGIPSRMLIFPDENHWILQPQNGILFQREFFRWFDQWLK